MIIAAAITCKASQQLPREADVMDSACPTMPFSELHWHMLHVRTWMPCTPPSLEYQVLINGQVMRQPQYTAQTHETDAIGPHTATDLDLSMLVTPPCV